MIVRQMERVMRGCGMLVVMATTAWLSAAEFHVSLNGKDVATGTVEAPFATVARAQQAVAALTAKGLSEDVTIWLHGGFYPQAQTLVFKPADGGSEKFSVTYAAWKDEQPILSGGHLITGFRAEGKLWVADAPQWKGSLDDWPRPRTLYVNGRRAWRARTPNGSCGDPDFAADKERSIRILTSDLAGDRTYAKLLLDTKSAGYTAFAEPRDVELIYPGTWCDLRKRVEHADFAAGWFTLAGPHVFGFSPVVPKPVEDPQKSKRQCYLEGAREFLDNPGEWYCDRSAGKLYYMPRKDDKLPGAYAVAPVVADTLISIAGSETAPVRNLHFKGLVVAHVDWIPPKQGYEEHQANFYSPLVSQEELAKAISDGDGAAKLKAFDVKMHRQSSIEMARMPAAVEMMFAQDCSFADGAVAQVGGAGISIRKGSSRNSIAGNRIFDLGGNGVLIGEHWTHRLNPRNTKNPQAVPESWPMRDNVARDNYIHHVGMDYPGAVGVWVAFTINTTIEHNTITVLPYTGISLGFIWGSLPAGGPPIHHEQNKVLYNVIDQEGAGRHTDGGLIYTIGTNPKSEVVGNVGWCSVKPSDPLRGVMMIPGGAPYNGLFTDEGSENMLIDRNIMPGRRGNSPGKMNLTADNIFDFGAKPPSDGDFTAWAKANIADKGAWVMETIEKAGLEPPYRKLLETSARLPISMPPTATSSSAPKEK